MTISKTLEDLEELLTSDPLFVADVLRLVVQSLDSYVAAVTRDREKLARNAIQALMAAITNYARFKRSSIESQRIMMYPAIAYQFPEGKPTDHTHAEEAFFEMFS